MQKFDSTGTGELFKYVTCSHIYNYLCNDLTVCIYKFLHSKATFHIQPLIRMKYILCRLLQPYPQ
jgi:hypothetical protein